ncbi:MAG: tRNA (adenosine(37)-N6)-threonylcarbamoyltransferase complex dimerization subunit type 1 TsaB [Bifidobacteriaceae bacterium]|jgi:tRNA threonylcarbamoyladenosine biosynthesis protein TsaB|nr:tRNA (adenosine(37)-N6)-threonylcarbamoyltransferase complex dimerization subunit type 1 TsaB [Bifidobacteriaceae bacterium]
MPSTVPSGAAALELPGPVLGVDTSAGASVGLSWAGGNGIVQWSEHPRNQVEELIPLVNAVLTEAALKPTDVAAIAAGTGPATYTGLRIGLATVRTLGFALGIPVWGVCALDALAADAAARLSLPPGLRILATGDARRREIFWARYLTDDAGPPLPLDPPTVGAASEAPGAEIIVGGGAALYPGVLRPAPGGPDRVDPLVLAGLGAARAARGVDQPAEPIYLRRPDIAPPSPRKRVTA